MSIETKKVLEMLAEGKISAEDAERLLDKLSAAGGANAAAPGEQAKTQANSGSATGAKRPRFLRIQVERPGRGDVNMRVPLSYARYGQLFSVLPPRVAEKLEGYGVRIGAFSRMSDEEFQRLVEEMNIDIEAEHGKKVRIYAE